MRIHIVQKGETLWKIAKKYGVDFSLLKAANTQLKNFDKLMPGDKIKVPTEGKEVKKKLEFPKIPKKEAPIKKEFPIMKEAPIKKEVPIIKEEKKPLPAKPMFPIKEEPVKKELPKKEMPKPIPQEVPVQQPVYPGLQEDCVPMTGLLPGSGFPGDPNMPMPDMGDCGCGPEPIQQMPYMMDDCGCEEPWPHQYSYDQYMMHDMGAAQSWMAMPQGYEQPYHSGYPMQGMMPAQNYYGMEQMQHMYQQQMAPNYNMGHCQSCGGPQNYGYQGMGALGYSYPVQQMPPMGYPQQQMWGHGAPGFDMSGMLTQAGYQVNMDHLNWNNQPYNWQGNEMPQGMGYPQYNQNSLDGFWDIDVDFKPGPSREMLFEQKEEDAENENETK